MIAELPLRPRFDSGYRFAEVVALLDSSGFHMCDVLETARTGAGEATFVDALFRRSSDVR